MAGGERGPSPARDADEYLEAAQDALFEGKMDRVVRLCREGLALEEDNEDLLRLLQLAHEQRGDWGAAADVAATWAAVSESSAAALQSLARSAHRSGQLASLDAAMGSLAELGDAVEEAGFEQIRALHADLLAAHATKRPEPATDTAADGTEEKGEGDESGVRKAASLHAHLVDGHEGEPSGVAVHEALLSKLRTEAPPRSSLPAPHADLEGGATAGGDGEEGAAGGGGGGGGGGGEGTPPAAESSSEGTARKAAWLRELVADDEEGIGSLVASLLAEVPGAGDAGDGVAAQVRALSDEDAAAIATELSDLTGSGPDGAAGLEGMLGEMMSSLGMEGFGDAGPLDKADELSWVAFRDVCNGIRERNAEGVAEGVTVLRSLLHSALSKPEDDPIRTTASHVLGLLLAVALLSADAEDAGLGGGPYTLSHFFLDLALARDEGIGEAEEAAACDGLRLAGIAVPDDAPSTTSSSTLGSDSTWTVIFWSAGVAAGAAITDSPAELTPEQRSLALRILGAAPAPLARRVSLFLRLTPVSTSPGDENPFAMP